MVMPSPVMLGGRSGAPGLRDATIALATPKSVTVAASPVSRMLSGLMSRWTMPCSWA